MTKDFAKLGIIAALIVAFCGWGALGAVISGVWETIVAFWPIIQGCIEYVIEDYFTSPYFITGVIMAIASAFESNVPSSKRISPVKGFTTGRASLKPAILLERASFLLNL